MAIHKSFRLIEEAAERGNLNAKAAAEWISGTIEASFALMAESRHRIKLDGSDSCERVAEALAVWIEESNPLEFAEMTATRYQVNSLDCSAEGMERLRYQREFILIAYPGADSTPFELCRQWLSDLNGAAYPDGFCYEAAEHAIRQFCEDNAEAIQRELDSAKRQLEHESGEAESLGCDFDAEPDPFRLYVEDLHAEAAEAREAKLAAEAEAHSEKLEA